MPYSRRVRWDRFFDDLEDQLASEREAERAALDTEAERLRLARVGFRDRLEALVGGGEVSLFLLDGRAIAGHLSAVGADWLALEPANSRRGALIAPLGSVAEIGMPHVDVLRSARPPASARSPLADRLTFGYVLRDLVRRRVAVAAHLATGRVLTGTIDRAGADHFDLALHEPGAPRRAGAVTGHRVVPFAAVVSIHIEGDVGVL